MSIGLVDQIRQTMEGKSTEELEQIYRAHDASQWSDDAFEAVRQELVRRGAGAPAQQPSAQATAQGSAPVGGGSRIRFQYTGLFAFIFVLCDLPLFRDRPLFIFGTQAPEFYTALIFSAFIGAVTGFIMDLVRSIPKQRWARKAALLTGATLGVLSLAVFGGWETVVQIWPALLRNPNHESIAYFMDSKKAVENLHILPLFGAVGMVVGMALGAVVGGIKDLASRRKSA